MIYGELNVVLTDLSLGSTIELGGNILYGELSATLADSSLGSTVELSGNILYSVLGDASITSNGVVLVLGSGAAALDGITTTIAGLVPSNGSLLSTLEDVISRNFGTIYNGTLAPYEDVISWTGHPLTGSLVRVRTGNLVGVFGQPNEFGLFAGEGWDASSGTVPSASSKYIRLGSFTNEFHNVPINLYDDGVITMRMEPDAPSFAMGNPIPSGYATGTGLWQGKDTDDVYKWRVGDPSIGGSMLSWSGSSLSIVNGSLDIGGASSHIALGDPPPTSPTSGTGIWIDKNGLYGINDGVLQIFLDTLDGRLYIDGGTEFGVSPLLGNLYIEGVLTLGTDGKLLQGTGVWGVDFTGSAIWAEGSPAVMNIGGLNNNVKQWWGGSDGKFYAGGGDVQIDNDGIKVYPGNSLKFVDATGQDIVKAEVYNNFWNTPQVPCLQLGSILSSGNPSSGVVLSAKSENDGGIQQATVENTPGKFSIHLKNSIDTAGTLTKFTLMLNSAEKTRYFIMDTNYINIATDWMGLNGGLHVGGTSDPGADNLIVEGTIKDGSGVEYSKTTHDHNTNYLGITAQAADSAKVANTTPTAAGLALLSAADVPAQKQALGIKFTAMPQLKDDTATSITPPVSQGFFLIRKAGGSNGGALVAFDAVATPYTVLIAGTAIMAATTGALTGTTGTDGKITVSAHSDGKIYVENRVGAAIYLSYQVL